MISNKPLTLALLFMLIMLGCDSSGDGAPSAPEDAKVYDASGDSAQALPDAAPPEQSDVVTPKPDILCVLPDAEIPEVVEVEVELPADPMVCSGQVEGPLQYIGGACLLHGSLESG